MGVYKGTKEWVIGKTTERLLLRLANLDKVDRARDTEFMPNAWLNCGGR